MFAVYQTNKPATKHHHNMGFIKGWDKCSFEKLEDAIKYAQNWCGKSYPVVPNNAKIDTKYCLPFENTNGEIEFILIREYKKCVHTEHCCDVHSVCKYGEEDTCPCCNNVPIPATYGCNCYH